MVNAVYQKLGTAKVLKASGGDATFTPKNIANAAGRLSARLDLGAWPRTTRYRWYAETQCQATPTIGNNVRIYMSIWDDEATPALPWGGVGATDAAFATEADLRDLELIGDIVVDTAAANTIFQRGGLVEIPGRFLSVVWWNATGASLTNDDAEHQMRLTPIYDEIQ